MLKHRNKGTSKRWTPEDELLLRTKWGFTPLLELAEELGRTTCGLGDKAQVLGLITRKDDYTAASLSPLLGINANMVYRLIAKGLLGAVKRPYCSGHIDKDWRITKENVILFLQTHYLQYDPANVAEEFGKYIPYDKIKEWITLNDAAKNTYFYSIQWFYELIWRSVIRAKRGWASHRRRQMYLFKQDIDDFLRDRPKIFNKPIPEVCPTGYQKAAPRGKKAVKNSGRYKKFAR